MRYRFIALGIVIVGAAALSAQPAYRLHESGELWVAKAENCRGTGCVVWYLLDNHPMTREITAGGPTDAGFDPLKGPLEAAPPLYQRRDDGTIWLYTGKPCIGGACRGWQQLDRQPDNNPAVSIVAAGKQLYQRRRNGEIWSYTGKPCSNGSCPGWEQLDDNPETVEITAAGMPPDAPRLYQRRKNGEILRYRGTPCSGTSCWQLLDENPHRNAREITATVQTRSDGTPGHALYERRDDGIWRYLERPCNGAVCPVWEQIDNDPDTISIVTNQVYLYQLRLGGTSWVYDPRSGPCNKDGCPGWLLLDKNPRTRQIAAGIRSLYKLHDNGAIWRSPCENNECHEPWQLFYDPTMRTIVSTQH